MTEEDFDINQPAETIIDIDAPNYRQIITAIFAGNYSWAQVLNVKKEVIKIAQNMVNSGRSIKTK
ncbi:hypothetical protein [Umezakia ovalisporum]|uniref:hypothetical protein n=1 Tax=Umezakia ovalisporum TaxID=75695 RepID=UPI0035B7CF7D